VGGGTRYKRGGGTFSTGAGFPSRSPIFLYYFSLNFNKFPLPIKKAAPGEVSFWQGQFSNGLTSAEFINEVLQSGEYFHHTHPYP
jgi:hypothetical protein